MGHDGVVAARTSFGGVDEVANLELDDGADVGRSTCLLPLTGHARLEEKDGPALLGSLDLELRLDRELGLARHELERHLLLVSFVGIIHLADDARTRRRRGAEAIGGGRGGRSGATRGSLPGGGVPVDLRGALTVCHHTGA